MLDPEYVKRVDLEMEQSGGELAPDDHEAVWANLKACDEWGAQLEFGIALLTEASLDEVLEMTLNEAAKRHPSLSREEALRAEIRIRDAIERAAANRRMLDMVARMQSDPKTAMDLLDDEEDSVDLLPAGEEGRSIGLGEHDSD